jgi:hypothetical protein
MAQEAYPYEQPDLDDPLIGGANVTPSNTEDLGFTSRMLYIETGGTLALVMKNGDELTITVPDSMLLPFRVKRVKATGTSATGISAFY